MEYRYRNVAWPEAEAEIPRPLHNIRSNKRQKLQVVQIGRLPTPEYVCCFLGSVIHYVRPTLHVGQCQYGTWIGFHRHGCWRRQDRRPWQTVKLRKLKKTAYRLIPHLFLCVHSCLLSLLLFLYPSTAMSDSPRTSKLSNISIPSFLESIESDDIIPQHKALLSSMRASTQFTQAPKVDILRNQSSLMEMDKALLVSDHCPPAPLPTPWQPRNPNAIFTPDYLFNRKKTAAAPMTFRTADPVKSLAVASFPHPVSHISSPAHTVARPPPALLDLGLERLVNEDIKMSLNPFKEYVPYLCRLPLPYAIKAPGNWQLHHYSNSFAPHIQLPLSHPHLIEIQHSLHPSIAYALRFDSFAFFSWKFPVGQEVIFGDTRPQMGTYRFVQLLPSEYEGPLERVLALCMRDDGTGYFDCGTEYPPVEILLPRIFIGDSLLNAGNFPKNHGRHEISNWEASLQWVSKGLQVVSGRMQGGLKCLCWEGYGIVGNTNKNHINIFLSAYILHSFCLSSFIGLFTHSCFLSLCCFFSLPSTPVRFASQNML